MDADGGKPESGVLARDEGDRYALCVASVACVVCIKRAAVGVACWLETSLSDRRSGGVGLVEFAARFVSPDSSGSNVRAPTVPFFTVAGSG